VKNKDLLLWVYRIFVGYKARSIIRIINLMAIAHFPSW